MGEIADMMLDGTLCEGCGEYMGEDTGYPTYCSAQCAGDRGAGPAQVAGGAPSAGESKSQKRNRQKKRKKENYRDMKHLLQKTANMIDQVLTDEGPSVMEWNNHNQAIKARLMRVRLISMTPPGRVRTFHSRLTLGEARAGSDAL